MVAVGDRLALILAGPGDASGEQVALALARRACRVVRASLADLARARWSHSPEGGSRVDLPDGSVLGEASVGVVLNRLDAVDLPQFARAAPEDRDYASAEFTALLTSWLHGLGVAVANPPGGDNTYAAALHPLGWHALAAAQGLAVADFVVASSVRGGACAGLARVGGSAYPRGSDVAGWYRPAAAGREPAWAYVFGRDCCWLDEAAGALDADIGRRCVAFVEALGLRYAALGFASGCLVQVEPRPPLEGAGLAERCADWLLAELRARP